MSIGVQEFTGATPGGVGGPDPVYNAYHSTTPNRVAQYMQNWRGFDMWNTGMGLPHYPEQHRPQIQAQQQQQIYLKRNPPAWSTATPIPIEQYVLNQSTAYTGGNK